MVIKLNNKSLQACPESLMLQYLALIRKKMIGLIAELAMASQKAARKRCWVYDWERMEVL